MRYLKTTGLACAAVLATAGTLRALDSSDLLLLSKGPVLLRPQLNLRETYDNNVFYQETGLEHDFITTVSPGLKLNLGRRDANFLAVEYAMDESVYARHSANDATQHRFEISDHYKWNRLAITGEDRIGLLSGILGGGTYTTAQGQKVDRTLFSDTYTVSYRVSEKSSVYFRGAHQTSDFQEGVALFDSLDLTGTAGFEIKPFPKTGFFGEVYYGRTTVDPNSPAVLPPPRSTFSGGFLGVRGKFTRNLTGIAKVGYEVREFVDNAPAPSAPVVEIALTQLLSDKAALTLSYSRRTFVSVEFARQTYSLDAIDLQFTQQIGPSKNWKAKASATYSRYNYEPNAGVVRNDSLLMATAGVTYEMSRWVAAGLGYQFEIYESSIPSAIDYKVNRVTLSLAFGY